MAIPLAPRPLGYCSSELGVSQRATPTQPLQSAPAVSNKLRPNEDHRHRSDGDMQRAGGARVDSATPCNVSQPTSVCVPFGPRKR